MIIQKLEDYFLVKVYKEIIGDFNIFDVDDIQVLFQDVFDKLKKKYDLKGLLEVDVYIHLEYGMILEIRPICDYFEEVDVRIHIHLDSDFLVEIPMEEIINQEEVYYYQGKFYGPYLESSDSEVFYKNTDEIRNKGIKVC